MASPSPSTGRRFAWLLALTLGAGALGCLALNWPGQFSPDSVWQLQQGREGVFNTWHPPVMAWLLGRFDALSPGAPGFIAFDAALGYGGLLAFGLLARPIRPGAALVASGLGLSPLMLIYQGDVWKDVLFADASLAGFAALAWAARLWRRPWARAALIGAAFAGFGLAALARQNGAVVPICGAAGLGVIAWRAERDGPRRLAAALGHALIALAGCAALAGAAEAALLAHGDGEPAAAQQLEWLQAWDLAGAVRAEPGLGLAVLSARAPAAAAFLRGEAAPVWRPQRIDPLIGLGGADQALDDTGPTIARQWLDLILDHPLLYARVRLADFAQLVAAPDLMACRPLFLGLDGPAPVVQALGLTPPGPIRLRLGRAYGLAFTHSPVFSHLAYAALAVILAVLAWRVGAPEDPAVLAMLAAAAGFALSFLVAGVACDYRYLYFPDLAVMAALLHRAAAGWPRTVVQLSRERARKTR